MPFTPQALLQSMTWRCIGPPRGGRVVAVAGDPSQWESRKVNEYEGQHRTVTVEKVNEYEHDGKN